jgi:lipopolysaccharide transport system ATP-binding protein
MSDIAIRVENLSKRYRIGQREPYYALRDILARALTAPFRFFSHNERQTAASNPSGYIWALKDVSFEVKEGEIVGIIGRNGAGKTTLLKILARITKPTKGYAEVRGRVGSLLEVGTGFHPELTGRENIYLSGAILGMTKKEIDKKFDEIVAFAEIEKFIDTPVKYYSSGMYMRLAFAVAAHLEAEILIVDEVLAVGDAAFQKKCLGKMGEVAKEGRTVLFVSHNMAAVQNLCTGAYLLEKGRLIACGNVTDVIGRYLQTVGNEDPTSICSRRDRQGSGKLRFVEFSASGEGATNTTLVCGAPAKFVIRYRGTPPLQNVDISVGIYTLLDEGVLHLSNDVVGKHFASIPASGAFVCSFRKFPLMPGTYKLNLYCTVNGILADWLVDAVRIHVSEGDYFGSGKLPPKGYGAILVDHEWDVVE